MCTGSSSYSSSASSSTSFSSSSFSTFHQDKSKYPCRLTVPIQCGFCAFYVPQSKTVCKKCRTLDSYKNLMHFKDICMSFKKNGRCSECVQRMACITGA